MEAPAPPGSALSDRISALCARIDAANLEAEAKLDKALAERIEVRHGDCTSIADTTTIAK